MGIQLRIYNMYNSVSQEICAKATMTFLCDPKNSLQLPIVLVIAIDRSPKQSVSLKNHQGSFSSNQSMTPRLAQRLCATVSCEL